jgi:50S ribosome-binding GTPase
MMATQSPGPATTTPIEAGLSPTPAPRPSLAVVRGSLVARRLRLPLSGEGGVHVVATGRTGSGKTTLANRLLGVAYFLSDGRQDCTREVNHVRLPGGLSYSDLPGACSDDLLENVNRLALGLPQVDDAPRADELTIATHTPGRAPVRDRLAPEEIDGSRLAPDLILYLLAADKQFTSADRRYLLDLLARHSRIVYVLNIFATSPPSDPNVRDLVSRVAQAHRRARPEAEAPWIVPMDCQTGEGLADLLDAARHVLGGPAGELFADVLGDVDRATPRLFARELATHLIGGALDIRAAAGPTDARHPLRAAALAAFDLVSGYALAESAGGKATIARLLPIVAEAARSADTPAPDGPDPRELADELGSLARRLDADFLARVGRDRDDFQTKVEGAIREDRAASERRMDELRDREAALDALNEQVACDGAELRRRAEGLEAEVAAHSAALLDLRMQFATLEAEIDIHNDEMESHNDRVEDFQDVIRSIERAGGTDPSDVRRLERDSDRLNREGRGLERRGQSLNSDSRRLGSESDSLNHRAEAYESERGRFNEAVKAHNQRLDALRADQGRLAADQLKASREANGARLAREAYLTRYYEAYREQSDRVGVLRHRISHGIRGSERAEVPDETLARWRARLWADASEVSEASAAMRRDWCRFRIEWLVERVTLACVVDHFDEAESGAHRGSTFRPVGTEGAVAVLSAALSAAGAGDPLKAFADLLAEAGDSPSFSDGTPVFAIMEDQILNLIS